MKTKLSHSQVSRYQLCGQAYKYHYIDKLRPTTTSAALLFGTAIDDALNALVLKKDTSPEAIFEKTFRYQKINKVDTYLPSCVDLVYAETDYDEELFLKEDNVFMEEQIKAGRIKCTGNFFEYYKTVRAAKKEKGFENLSFDDKVFYNNMNWLSLKNKGLLMIDAYRRKILPKIEKVHAVQKYVALENPDGDKIIGYVDLIADIKDIGTCILDNKTSASEYEDDAVLTSPQLSLYTHILEPEYKTRKAGYVVMRKSVIKNRKKICEKCGNDGSGGRHKTCDKEVNGVRCHGQWNESIDPDISIQFIVDEIPPITEEIVIKNYDEVNAAIKAEVFTRNFNTCQNHYGGNCPYINLCFRNSKKGLKEMK